MNKKPPTDNSTSTWQPTRDGPQGLLDRLAKLPAGTMQKMIADQQAKEAAHPSEMAARAAAMANQKPPDSSVSTHKPVPFAD